jgi:hypothetical protein
MDSEKAVHIPLSGDNILEEHCYFENTDGKVTLHALPEAITVRLYRPFIPGPYVIVRSSSTESKFLLIRCGTRSMIGFLGSKYNMFSPTSFTLASASFLVSSLVAEVN